MACTRGVEFLCSPRSSSGQQIYSCKNNIDSGACVFTVTFNLEIWMGENFLILLTEGTSLLNKACERASDNSTVKMHDCVQYSGDMTDFPARIEK